MGSLQVFADIILNAASFQQDISERQFDIEAGQVCSPPLSYDDDDGLPKHETFMPATEFNDYFPSICGSNNMIPCGILVVPNDAAMEALVSLDVDKESLSRDMLWLIGAARAKLHRFEIKGERTEVKQEASHGATCPSVRENSLRRKQRYESA
jgi:hypothetical protein